jgi:hypothetical protein
MQKKFSLSTMPGDLKRQYLKKINGGYTYTGLG